ncbi:UNVERIFIED_CONTAM: hypothetical protein PYX00_007240 [Menopon gallinae]|uniref:Uncharacterized protein n=1 Tax=Menopon gallinae TaxID=328185 RepID=A0AAW2HIF0_9NEOP
MVSCVVLCMLACAAVGYAESATDSEAAAITVYRNPEFFGNLNRRNGREEQQRQPADEERADVYNSEEFYDFDDDYRYPGEPKKPNPPAAPDFAAYYDSFGYQPEPYGEEQQEEERPDEHRRSEDDRQEGRYAAEEERPEQREDENELNEDEEEQERYEEEEEREEEPAMTGKYHVQMEKDLQMQVPKGTYEESKQYYNPFFGKGMKSFSYPASYSDLDYYSKMKPAMYKDNKKGTREYLRDHSVEEVEEEPDGGHHRADTKHILKAMSKFAVKAVHPILYVHLPKKIKYKYVHKPRKVMKKIRFAREIPDDSAYQLSSDYDSEFEFF